MPAIAPAGVSLESARQAPSWMLAPPAAVCPAMQLSITPSRPSRTRCATPPSRGESAVETHRENDLRRQSALASRPFSVNGFSTSCSAARRICSPCCQCDVASTTASTAGSESTGMRTRSRALQADVLVVYLAVPFPPPEPKPSQIYVPSQRTCGFASYRARTGYDAFAHGRSRVVRDRRLSPSSW